MFDIGWGELIVIGVVALIAIGPKELPGVLRTVGHWVGKMRRMANEFQGQFQEALREAELADLKKQFDEAASAAGDITKRIENPLESTRKEIEASFADKPALTETTAAAEHQPAAGPAESKPAKPESGTA
ncbi:MAG TPA: Sec-independent protein translocase protein TatB [Pseudorhodoplanes sp.]|jgi:sec-independent protein translocase protein TatB|nr:Sec-independent protein translocase protein TatB [Pseudorhodoplanes sp.]